MTDVQSPDPSKPKMPKKRHKKRANGEGTVVKRLDGRWEARLIVREAGVLRRRSLYARTEREAARKLREALGQRDQGLPLPSGRDTVSSFLEQWLEGVAPSLRQTSLRRYRQVLGDYALPTLGRRRLVDLDPEHIAGLYADMLARGLSPSTVRLLHVVLRRALDQAHRWRRVARNVADLVDQPRLDRREAASLSFEQAHRLLAAAADSRLEPLWVLALTFGLRRGELIALRWDAVDLDAGTVRVVATMAPVPGGGNELTEPKSQSSRRTIPLGAAASELMRRHRARQVAERIAVGQKWQGNDPGYVFATAVGRPLSPTKLVNDWQALLAEVGLSAMPFHATRHTAATLLLRAGVDPKVSAQILGHASAVLTLDRYSHPGADQKRSAATAVEHLMES